MKKKSLSKKEQLFMYLVGTFQSSAWIALGKIENPMTEKTKVNTDQASFYIDLLDMMQEKMRGNLTDYEKQMLINTVSELKLKLIDEKKNRISQSRRRTWRIAQWVTSGWLFFAWLQHDMANIAVFLPRQLSFIQLLMVLCVTIGLLGYIFYTQGGKIQSVVLDKQGTRYVRSATIINVVYIAVLYIFKELNNLPMSTTWVFVGLLAGRELAISTVMKDYKFVYVFPIIAKDFGKMMLGLGVSVAVVLLIHYVLIPSGF